MSKTQSKLGVTLPETPNQENLIYSGYLQYSSVDPYIADGIVYNNFPTDPVWDNVGTGLFEMSTGLGYTFTNKNSQEILVSKVIYDGAEGGTDLYSVTASLIAGTDKIKFNIYNTSGILSNVFGAFYIRVTVFQ